MHKFHKFPLIHVKFRNDKKIFGFYLHYLYQQKYSDQFFSAITPGSDRSQDDFTVTFYYITSETKIEASLPISFSFFEPFFLKHAVPLSNSKLNIHPVMLYLHICL